MDGIHVFLNGARGVALIRWLHGNRHKTAEAYVPANSPMIGRIGSVCKELGVPCKAVDNPNADHFLEGFLRSQPQLSIIAGFPIIFGRCLIEVPRLGTINLHAGRVPQYRGGSPLNWQLANGEAIAGISVLQVDEGIDNGDVLAEALLPILPDDDIASLHERVNTAFPDLVGKVLDTLGVDGSVGRPQNSDDAQYWHQRNDDDGRIFWRQLDAQGAHDLIRAVTRPYPGAFSFFDGRIVRIFRSSLSDMAIRGVPGRICYVNKTGPYVVCRDRAILVHDYAFEDNGATQRLSHGSRLH